MSSPPPLSLSTLSSPAKKLSTTSENISVILKPNNSIISTNSDSPVTPVVRLELDEERDNENGEGNDKENVSMKEVVSRLLNDKRDDSQDDQEQSTPQNETNENHDGERVDTSRDGIDLTMVNEDEIGDVESTNSARSLSTHTQESPSSQPEILSNANSDDKFSPHMELTQVDDEEFVIVSIPTKENEDSSHSRISSSSSSLTTEGSQRDSSDTTTNSALQTSSSDLQLSSIIRRQAALGPVEDVMPSYMKHQDQDVTSKEWKQHSKHIFIMSKAGKPIFTRYGDETDLNPLMGFFAVLVDSILQDDNDAIQYLEYGSFKVVFRLRDEIILIAMCKTLSTPHDTSSHVPLLSTASNSRLSAETPKELESQLDAIYNQIEFFVTSHLQRKLASFQSFDVRRVLGGTDAILHNLISAMSRTLHFSWQSYRTLRLKNRTRSQIADLMMRYKPDDLCYGLLLSRGQLVHILRSRKWALHASDLLLLLNFVKSNSSLKNSDTWTPVCLPTVKNNGYLFAYITFIDVAADLCLMYICSSSDRFSQCATAKKKLMKTLLQSTKLFNELIKACNEPRFSVTELKFFPNLRHFVYFNHSCNQLADARYTLPYNQRDQQKRLIREYKAIREQLMAQSSTSHPVYFQTNDHETILAYQTPQYELYATFSLLVSKQKAVFYCEEIEKYVKKHEDSLFLNVATF